MLGPTDKVVTLLEGRNRRLVPAASLILPSPNLLRELAQAALATRGLRWQADELLGESMILMLNGQKRYLRHSLLYTAAEPREILDAALAHMNEIERRHGPGAIWFLLDPVHIVTDDERIPVTSDPPEVLVRTIYGHESQAAER